MAKTIGNPLTWAARGIGGAFTHAAEVADRMGGSESEAEPVAQEIGMEDLKASLRAGFQDFTALRTDVIFICLIYPIMGAVLVAIAVQGDLIRLLFPLLSGFALIGPFAAVGLYEMSRRRERGEKVGWSAMFEVVLSPRFGALFMLGLFHVAIFAVWLMVADLIYKIIMGTEDPIGMGAFFSEVLTTPAGWTLIVVGSAVGFLFAVAVLASSVVSFPLLLDRRVGLPVAVATSLAVARKNPVTIATWGLIVAVSLAIGILPFLIGLVIVLPILGHATWHLYRRAVSPV